MRGRILKGIAGFYYVETIDLKVYECKAKGIFRKSGIKPIVGDNVEIEIIDEDNRQGNLTDILPRKNCLYRPPVANVDQAVILFAIVKPDPNYNLLDRFLIMMRQQNLPVIICFNKQDIATKEEQKELHDAYEKCGYKVLFVSVKEERGLDELKALLKGKTSTLAGPSGVGKSSLLNKLVPDADMQIGELSRKIDRGKNTTRHSELFYVKELSEGGEDTFIIDTPGFTSLELRDVTADELMGYYPEFEQFEPSCRFGGCSHIAEPDCGVKAALEAGELSNVRYDNYRIIYKDLKNARPDYSKKKNSEK
ncbi:ribosome small subunit-dependent GTPase A [Butyrivibrio sp. NC2007]|uniref:ribosome small subunit-dependent GTPase A n=1 Tax=Butyrivibrio sp. NC2007 TaxID=1280683 RepID=UPI0003B4145B|nr:ribosome small subunit-dependent GTPase A [Butyrivibrio sp. NC2007]